MPVAAVLALILLFFRGRSPRGQSATPAAQAAQKAQAHAHRAAKRAAQTNHPADHAAAADAADRAAVLTHHAATQAQHAAMVPAPWPSVVPKDLPPWPSGWKPMQPPSGAVVARAWQLLAPLWKRGAGSKAVEQTGGKWVTYVAADMGAGKRGVTAWVAKSEPVHEHRDQPVANA